jgi:hypothetical protein
MERGEAVEAMDFLAELRTGGMHSPRPKGTCTSPKVFLDGETLWRLDCIVSKTGWPNQLWDVDLFGRELIE